MQTTGRSFRIGQLADAAGITVRALRHYDEVGLLVPSERTDAGHRLYSDSDVARLYLIVTFRALGMSLETIAAQLDGRVDTRAAIERHLAAVEKQILVQDRLRRRLRKLLEATAANESPSTDELLETLEVISMHEKYYTEEQLDDLARRREALGDDAIKQAEQEWTDLIAAVEAERARGTDPTDERVQALARRWQGLIEQFTGGDPSIFQSLTAMYESEGVEAASRGAVSSDLMEYVGRAMQTGPGTG
ncbi:MAG TPA: MerR family transcriptional regulator [Actinomycetota bacterium]|jgi:DNA-binding transcriptional MerR regulator